MKNGHLLPDHVHSGVASDWVYQGEERDSPGVGVWGESVSTFGHAGTKCPRWGDETVIRDYIRNQEQEDKSLDQMNLWR